MSCWSSPQPWESSCSCHKPTRTLAERARYPCWSGRRVRREVQESWLDSDLNGPERPRWYLRTTWSPGSGGRAIKRSARATSGRSRLLQVPTLDRTRLLPGSPAGGFGGGANDRAVVRSAHRRSPRGGDQDQGAAVPAVERGREPHWEPQRRTTSRLSGLPWTADKNASEVTDRSERVRMPVRGICGSEGRGVFSPASRLSRRH
jgi:hypothetical protein